MNRQKALIFSGITIAALALIPLIDGLYIKHYYLEMQQQFFAINGLDQPNSGIKVDIDYRPGWLSSEATLILSPGSTNPPTRLTFTTTIHHGPIVYDVTNKKFTLAIATFDSHIQIPEPYASQVLGEHKDAGIFQAFSLLSFGHKLFLDGAIPAIAYQNDGREIKWQGLTHRSVMQIDNDYQISSVNTVINIGTLSMQQANAPTPIAISAQPIIITYQAARTPIGLWAGNMTTAIPGITASNANASHFTLENLAVSASNNISDNMVNAKEQVTLKKLELSDKNIPSIAPASFNLEINHLNARELARFYQFARNQNSDSAPTEALQAEIAKQFLTILTPTTSLNADTAINTTQGNFQAKGKAFLNGQPTSLAAFTQNINVTLDARIASSLATYLIQQYFQHANAAIKQTSAEAASPQNQAIEQFNAKVAAMLQKKQIALASAMQIMNLRSQNPSIETFQATLAKMNLPAPAMTEILSLYTNYQQQAQQATQNAAVAADPIMQSQQAINVWIQQGYIVQSGSDYTISISRTAGIWNVNGKPIQTESSAATATAAAAPIN